MPHQERRKSTITFRANADVAIHVPDLAKAKVFYGDVLGLPVLGRSDHHLEFDAGTFHLYANLDKTARSFIPSFSVSDPEAAKHHLKAAGCKAIKGSATYYEDPFGFAFDIIKS